MMPVEAGRDARDSSLRWLSQTQERARTQVNEHKPACKPLASAIPPGAPTLDETILKSDILGARVRICSSTDGVLPCAIVCREDTARHAYDSDWHAACQPNDEHSCHSMC